MKQRLTLIAACAALGGCATMAQTAARPEAPEVTKALAGKLAEAPRTCLSLSDANSSATYDGTILYRVSRSLTYRNDMNGCSAMRHDDIPVVTVFGSQICRGDIVRFVDRLSGFPTGSCTFGDFVPYRTPPGGGGGATTGH